MSRYHPQRYVATHDPRADGARCDMCPLKRHGPPVFGEGPKDATMAYIGEAPGHEEIRVGRPFWGRSGAALDEALKAVGLVRGQVYIDNALLCLPPGGSLEDFLTAVKREAREAGIDWHHPVDCCRPRLFKALRVPRCKECGKWRTGPEVEICRCQSPLWILPGGKGPAVIQPLGNAGLRALTGFEGIQKWRGSPINMLRHAGRAK